MRRYEVGVVGTGIGRSHIEAFLGLPEIFDVVAVCDVDEARAQDAARRYGIGQAVTGMARLCEMDEIEIVDICTPSYLHAQQAQQALAAGKHVICEKPVAGSLKEVDTLLQAEAASGKRMMPIFQKRFGHGLQKLKYLVDQGLTGPAYLTTVETAWRRRAAYYAVPWRGKWETELGGALVTLAIHAHDMLCYVLGPVKSVFARTKTAVNPIETEDCVSASLEMADGSLATLAVTTGSAVQISRHRFCFQRLTAESNLHPYHNSCEPWAFAADTAELQAEIQEALGGFEPLSEGFEGQFYRFHRALTGDGALPVTLADAQMALELVTALYHSARTGRVVELPLAASHPGYGGWQVDRPA